MYDLPTSIEINNHHFAITNKGDYRMVIDCFMALEDPELEEEDRIYAAMMIFYEDLTELEDIEKVFGENFETALHKMLNFFNCNQSNIGYQSKSKLIDWEQDEQLIISAVNNVAGKELRFEPYVHWFTFVGYYMAVGESALSTVVGIRDKIARGKKLEKYENEYRRDNPQYFVWKNKTAEEQRMEDYIRALWDRNSEKAGE